MSVKRDIICVISIHGIHKGRHSNTLLGARMVKWTKKMLQYTKTILFLVKGLKVVTKYCLDWDFL